MLHHFFRIVRIYFFFFKTRITPLQFALDPRNINTKIINALNLHPDITYNIHEATMIYCLLHDVMGFRNYLRRNNAVMNVNLLDDVCSICYMNLMSMFV